MPQAKPKSAPLATGVPLALEKNASRSPPVKAIKTVRMVVKDGTFYFPSEIYPKFGIEPFVAAPQVTMAHASASAPQARL